MAEQLKLPIEYAPAKVRKHGYSDAHSMPLVSRGKRGDLFSGSFRVPPQEAWLYPSIELRAGNSYPAIILDLDYTDAVQTVLGRHFLDEIPRPNWMVERIEKGSAHIVWCLGKPVHRGADSREAPVKALGRVAEWLAQELDADRGYQGVLAHNPHGRAKGRRGVLKTHWGRTKAYELKELGEYIPAHWRMPAKPVTAEGRNCALFRDCMGWAGSPRNLGQGVLGYAMSRNELYTTAEGAFMNANEVQGIARSVERYRARWVAQGRFGWTSEQQAEHGRKSGQARRERNKERDEDIVRMYAAGLRQEQIAGLIGVSQQTVSYVARRDMPSKLVLF